MAGANKPQITADEQRELVRTLGVDRSVGSESLTVSRVRDAVEGSADPGFASLGESIRERLEGELDAELLETELSNLATQVDRLPDVREAGIPDGEREPEELYRELVEPGWNVYDHLLEVGFFESVDEEMPRFTADVIRDTARELVRSDALTDELTDLGFDEPELTALVMSVTNNDMRLSRWVPTADIPEEVEFDVEHVPPLHQRASGGALLWTQTLDVHLWQKSVLITDQILDDAYWDVKAMFAGQDLVTRAALEVADPDRETLTDAELTAALTAGAAILIINQEAVCQDAYRITEEMRAPSTVR